MSGEPLSVLITGSSRGIGNQLAQRMLARGDRVYGCARTGPTITHDRYSHFVADVADDAAVREMFSEISARGTGLQLVVNNAGLSHTGLAILTGAVDAEKVILANLLGAFLVSREAIKLMKRAGFGRIIHFSSISVPLAAAGNALYNASKAGVENLALTLSREFGTDDITINNLGISMAGAGGMLAKLSPHALAATQQMLPKPKPIEIEEIVHAIDFLAAPEARNITGQTIYYGGIA